MMFARGAYGGFNCFGPGMMGPGGHLLIAAGVIAVIVLIVYLVRKNKAKAPDTNALEMLKMKLVQGDITVEEYVNKKEALEKK